MPIYRCYFIDAANRFADVESFEAPDTDSAVARGRLLLRTERRFAACCGIELWLDAHRVHTDDPLEA